MLLFPAAKQYSLHAMFLAISDATLSVAKVVFRLKFVFLFFIFFFPRLFLFFYFLFDKII